MPVFALPGMSSPLRSAEEISRPLIVQCRREIEIGWQHVEAARAVLRNSRWLLARWNGDRSWAMHDVPIVPKPDMFIPADDGVAAPMICRRRARATA